MTEWLTAYANAMNPVDRMRAQVTSQDSDDYNKCKNFHLNFDHASRITFCDMKNRTNTESELEAKVNCAWLDNK